MQSTVRSTCRFYLFVFLAGFCCPSFAQSLPPSSLGSHFANEKTVSMAKSADSLPRYFAVNPHSLAESKNALAAGDARMQAAFKTLHKDAETALKATPPSVMEKTKLPPSGDKHDYMTVAPYFWPDSAKKDGLPYIRHDGKANPDSRTDVYDRKRLSSMASSIRTLALAYYFTGNESYAQQTANCRWPQHPQGTGFPFALFGKP